MLSLISSFRNRVKAANAIRVSANNSLLLLSPDTKILVDRSSSIKLIKNLTVGYPLPNSIHAPSYSHSIIKLGKNSTLICNGETYIANGCVISVGDNATLVFEGKNFVDHGTKIICNKKMVFGEGARISWNCSLIDQDGHTPIGKNGIPLRIIPRSMLIGKNVGIQMNVSIPSGVTIGDHSVISANACVRVDIPSKSLAYSDSGLKIKPGLSNGFGISNSSKTK